MTGQSLRKLEQLKSLLSRGRDAGDHTPGGPNSTVLERARKWILHYNIQHLHGPEEVNYSLNELVVFCLVRNGRSYVRPFIEYYLSLGAKHIILLDNGSTDGTVQMAREYENVTVFWTNLPFKIYQVAMKQYLIERFARGRWALCVDIDELFDYPYSDVVGLGAFLDYLGERSYTAVVTQMLDMFPEEPIMDTASSTDELQRERHRFYDISNVHPYNYVEYKRVGGPSNSLANQEITVYKDGIKKTVFPNFDPILTKHALVFLDERIWPLEGNAHKTSNARVADVSCVLFHYKFLDNLYGFVRQAVREENYMKDSRKHKLWMETLTQKPSLQIKSETSRELRSTNDLVHNQFLVVSREYMTLVDEEDRTGGSASRGEPSQLIEALFETRAEIRAQAREVEQLRQQIEKLRRRLARQREEAKTVSATVGKQAQDIDRSKGRRLLDKLVLARARMLGGSKKD